jgi:hypothetical protein
MMRLRTLSGLVLGLVAALAVGVGCGSSGGGNGAGSSGGGSDDGGLGNYDATLPANFNPDGGGGGGDGSTSAFQISPSTAQTLNVPAGTSSPTLGFTATLNGQPVNAAWSIDRGDIAGVNLGPSASSTFTPRGTTGGYATITATLNNQTASCTVLVKLLAQQNGFNPSGPGEANQNPVDAGQLSAGGGVGGVGGEGLGPPVTDPGTISALGSPNGDAGPGGLTMLYPYDRTVWPRGLLAPLLMWQWAVNDADAIQITLATTSGSFSYKGTFGRPAILSATGGNYIRSPIPQDVWTMATNTAGETSPSGVVDQLTMSLTIAKNDVGYGPITQTWNVAPGRLTGTVYYNVYGTQYVKNWVNTDSAGNPVGAAVLGIHAGDLSPHLVVGQNSPLNASGIPTDDTGCRVCHVVSSKGRWIITQSEQGTPGDGLSFLYDLTQPDAGAATLAQQGTFAWAAMTGAGTYALTNTINPSSSNPAITNSSNNTATSSFWQFGPTPTAATLTGLPAGVAAGYPTYSPDDTMIAYVNAAGSETTVDGPITVANYDATTQAFSNVRSILSPQDNADAAANPPATGLRVGYPVFLPDDSALLFENGVRAGSDAVMATRNGARSELWWVTLGTTPQASPLYALNGRTSAGATYLPILPNNHGIGGATDPQDSQSEVGWDDSTLNYEPTVLPIVVGGYAWVVFTSRRAYGNQLDTVPYNSWPQNYNTTLLSQAPVKKLYVAAIDLNAPPGTDPSHPAFYLPGQEILAGNSRGFWVLDPCQQNGSTCTSGDQCCNGFCEPAEDGGLVCGSAPVASTCSGTQDACKVSSDCCDTTEQCIAGFCAQPPPK